MTSAPLSSFTQGKNNNFNLIRIIAALAVLVSHSFSLLLQPEPFGQSLGMSMGSIAVDIFFVASGFLVAGSLLARQSVSEYVLARVLRIYPALIVMLVLTVFVLGAVFTSVPLDAYYTNGQVYSYLMRCLTLISGVAYYLPGVFESNPFKGAVNGSLWTLVYEIKMYIFLALFWLVSALTKKNRTKMFNALMIASAVLALGVVFFRHFYLKDDSHAVRLFFMFFSGAAYWVLKDRIRLSTPLFLFLLCASAFSLLMSQDAFFIVYQLGVAYALFYIAYVPAGAIRQYNALGDYSYGVYIYAFPVQQAVVALFPGISVAAMMAMSAAVTLMLAILSWHVIEKRAMRLKEFFLQRSRRALTGEYLPIAKFYRLFKVIIHAMR